jgi:uncharacterized membrane protein YfcA
MTIVLSIVLGLAAGVLSGLLGIGGGILIVPAFVLVFGFSQHLAQGTTLALMVPPIGLLAAWTYYKHGDVNVKVAALVCLGFFIGGLFGARWATQINPATLRRLFGVALLISALKMILTK